MYDFVLEKKVLRLSQNSNGLKKIILTDTIYDNITIKEVYITGRRQV